MPRQLAHEGYSLLTGWHPTSFHPSWEKTTPVLLHPLECLGLWNNDTDFPRPLRDDCQASQRNKNGQVRKLLSQKDLLMVIVVVGSVVTTIFLVQLVF